MWTFESTNINPELLWILAPLALALEMPLVKKSGTSLASATQQVDVSDAHFLIGLDQRLAVQPILRTENVVF